MPTIQSASERERAACLERGQLGARAAGRRTRPGSPSVVIEFSHSRWTGFFEPGLLVQVGEDQLALAPGVAGVDDEVDVVAPEQPLDHVHLLLRALVADDELEALGDDRQVGHPPLLERSSYSSGSASWTRWPTAHVTTCSGPSR